MIERNVKALSYDRELEDDTQNMVDVIVKSIHDNNDVNVRKSEDIREAASLENHVSELSPADVGSDDRYRINESGELIYDPEQELRRRYDRDEDSVEALQESFESLFELFKSFKELRFFYMSALEEVAEEDGNEAIRNDKIDTKELFKKLEGRYNWSEKVTNFTKKYADLLETRLVDYREELEKTGYRKQSQIDNQIHHSHQRFF